MNIPNKNDDMPVTRVDNSDRLKPAFFVLAGLTVLSGVGAIGLFIKPPEELGLSEAVRTLVVGVAVFLATATFSVWMQSGRDKRFYAMLSTRVEKLATVVESKYVNSRKGFRRYILTLEFSLNDVNKLRGRIFVEVYQDHISQVEEGALVCVAVDPENPLKAGSIFAWIDGRVYSNIMSGTDE